MCFTMSNIRDIDRSVESNSWVDDLHPDERIDYQFIQDAMRNISYSDLLVPFSFPTPFLSHCNKYCCPALIQWEWKWIMDRGSIQTKIGKVYL